MGTWIYRIFGLLNLYVGGYAAYLFWHEHPGFSIWCIGAAITLAVKYWVEGGVYQRRSLR